MVGSQRRAFSARECVLDELFIAKTRQTDRQTDNLIVANTGLCSIASYADAL